MTGRYLSSLLVFALLAGCAGAPAPDTSPEAPPATEQQAAPVQGLDGAQPQQAAQPEKAGVPEMTRPAASAAKKAEAKPAAKAKTPTAAAKVKPASNLDEAKSRARDLLKELDQKKKAQADAGEKKSARQQKEIVASAEVVERYKKLLEMPGTPEERKPEILLRLAEYSFEQESAALKQAYELGTDMDIEPGSRYPKSIEYYKLIADNHPKSAQALTAFYNLGFLYAEEGMIYPSSKAYGEVLKRDPKNPYATEIHMRLGETAFSLGTYREALTHYQAVVASGRADYLDKALFKLGWTHYKLDEYPTAIATFSRILDKQKGAPRDLVVETIDIMSKCFVESGGVEALSRYLAGVGPAKIYGDLIYQRLGDQYRDASRFADAVAAYEKGVEAYPLTDAALDMEKGVISSLNAMRDFESINLRRRKWLDLYAPGTPWDKANREILGSERDVMLEEGVRLAALYRHNRAQRGEGSLEAALDLYFNYETLYGIKTIDGYEMAYSFAQALKEAGRYADSASRYKAVAQVGDFTSHREEASYRRIDVLNILRQKDPAAFDEFLQAHEDYVRLNPDSALVPQLLFAMGEINFDAERFGPAAEAFERVAKGYPSHRLAPEAVERIARCAFRQNDFAGAEREARRALEFNPDSSTAEQALKLISFSIFKQAELAEQSGELDASVKHFFRLAKEFPDGEAAQVSLYRGAENLRKLKREEEAAAVYRQLAEKYSTSQYAESALSLSSEILSSLGDWHGVAVDNEKLYRMNPEAEAADKHLFRAALAREKAGEMADAARLFDEFAAKYAASPLLAQAIYRSAAMREKLGETEAANKGFEKVWLTKADGDENLYRAKAALRLGELQLELFKAVELKGNLEKALDKKEKFLTAALGRLADAAGFPYGETMAASLYYAGEAFEHMKSALLDSERPKGLNEEELGEYQFVLEERAFPLEEKATDFYRKGVAAARKAGVYNEWVERMYGRLEVLIPYAFQRTEQAATAWIEPGFPRRGWKLVKR